VPRPPKPRRVGFFPAVTYFSPAGIPESEAGELIIGVDEWEAIRLKDYLGIDQQESAGYMNLAQSTFQRILTSARTKLAAAMVEGKAIRIETGGYPIVGHWFCQKCGYQWESVLEAANKIPRLCPSCGTEHANQRHGHGWDSPSWPGPGRRRRGGR